MSIQFVIFLGIAKSIASLSDASETPCEVRILNKAEVITVGVTNDNGESLAKVMTLLSETPKGDTPICKQIKEITLRVKEIFWVLL